MSSDDHSFLAGIISHEIFGGPPPRPEISLRFFSKTHEPAEITGLLGIEPTMWLAPNGVQKMNDGTELSSRYGTWIWVIRGVEEASLQEGIAHMLENLPDDPELWQLLTSRYQADILCDFGVPAQSCSVELSVSLMRGLVARNLSLNFDMAPLT